ncbi:membrane fusion protein MtrC [Geobacter sp. OR-1]|uniref:efflux RND transporter periplasmic adaptor subunit n=1 Tax=Geobacter sp. OR-1 TaxID=1266765 RepID=UPI00054430F6|nr:efflux RND transporter periplasmic adaptor subunit [Geobacter sp. OR-1]GAM09882.1 membrane fusion protein MtrC [Geobacter sp. OR-1]
MKKYAYFLMTLALAGLTACSGKGEAKKAGVQKPPVAVDVAKVAPMPLVEGIEVTGSLEPKFYADIKTQIPGLVKQVFVTEWVRVRKGQPLAKIDVAETEALVKRFEANVESAKAGLAQAQVAVSRADRELARIRKLKESGLATQQAVDDATTEAEAAQARIAAARAQIRAAEEEVRQGRARQAKGMVAAPMDGVVSLREVNVGDLASDAAAAKPIFRIVDNRLLNLTVTIPSAESARARVGQPLEFTVDSLPGKVFSGKVMYINPELNSGDRSLKVIAEVPNVGDLLKGGLFAKGKIISGKRNDVVQLPRQALSAWDTAAKTGTLFVVTDDMARLRRVTTGAVSNELVEIVSGVKPGETYVVRGGFNLRDGDKVTMAGGVKQR